MSPDRTMKHLESRIKNHEIESELEVSGRHKKARREPDH